MTRFQESLTEAFGWTSAVKFDFVDIGAELDAEKRERFIDGLLETQTQVFVTAIEQEQLEFVNKYKDKKLFHVEHCNVNEE